MINNLHKKNYFKAFVNTNTQCFSMHQFNLKFTPVLTSSPHFKIDPFQLTEFREANWEVSTSLHQGQIIACGLSRSCWRYVVDSDSWVDFTPMNYSHNRMPGSVNTLYCGWCPMWLFVCRVKLFTWLQQPNQLHTNSTLQEVIWDLVS